MATARNIIKICLQGLDDTRLRTLATHVNKGTQILCGRVECTYYFVYEGVSDPIILACYAGKYPETEATLHDIHPDVAAIYQVVNDRAPTDSWSDALVECTQHDIRSAVLELVTERGMILE